MKFRCRKKTPVITDNGVKKCRTFSLLRQVPMVTSDSLLGILTHLRWLDNLVLEGQKRYKYARASVEHSHHSRWYSQRLPSLFSPSSVDHSLPNVQRSSHKNLSTSLKYDKRERRDSCILRCLVSRFLVWSLPKQCHLRTGIEMCQCHVHGQSRWIRRRVESRCELARWLHQYSRHCSSEERFGTGCICRDIRQSQ